MNVSYLESNKDSLINHMKTAGYSVSYIKKCRSMINHIIRQSGVNEWKSYDEVRAWILSNEDFCERSRKEFQFSITIIQRFDEMHEYPIHPVDENQMSSQSHSAGHLDLYPIQERMTEFEQSMIEKNFGIQYIKKIKQFAARIIVLSRTIPWDSFDDIRKYYRDSDLSKASKQDHVLAIDKMEAFLLNGKVRCRQNAPHCIEDAVPSLGALNLYEFKDSLPELERYMADNHYSAPYIRKVIIKAERLIVQSGQVKWDSYQDILDWHREHGYNESFNRELRTIVGIMSALHLHNIFPDNRATPNPVFPRANRYQQLKPNFKSIVDYGCEAQKKRGLSDSSVERAWSEATSFFYSLQCKGLATLDDVSENDVLDFFRASENNKGRTTLHALSRFIRDCIPLNPFIFRKIDEYIPITHQARKTIQYLTVEECEAFQQALEDMDNDLTLKQRAIGTLLFYTGMRASDVANLKLDSVDLKNQRLNFTQVKTDVSVTLPLLPVVGNAIYDYCTLERPVADSTALFLGQDAPYHSISAGAIGYVVEKIMDRACIRMSPEDRRGSHIFRHRAATKMAENNIPAPVISATLGQTSPKALDSYLSADIVHLRECAIPLGNYSISKEVFENVAVQ